jgi:tRNA(Ile)-lysidine synthase
MKDLVLKAVSQLNLLSSGDTVTVAFSGGADSVALLYSLYSLKDKLGITVNAAHLNHLIRG